MVPGYIEETIQGEALIFTPNSNHLEARTPLTYLSDLSHSDDIEGCRMNFMNSVIHETTSSFLYYVECSHIFDLISQAFHPTSHQNS